MMHLCIKDDSAYFNRPFSDYVWIMSSSILGHSLQSFVHILAALPSLLATLLARSHVPNLAQCCMLLAPPTWNAERMQVGQRLVVERVYLRLFYMTIDQYHICIREYTNSLHVATSIPNFPCVGTCNSITQIFKPKGCEYL